MSTKSERKQRKRERQRQEKRHQESPPPSDTPPPMDTTKTPDAAANCDDVTKTTANQNAEQLPATGNSPMPRSWFSWIGSPGLLPLTEIAFTGLVALFTGLQVYYGNKQWVATEKQYDSMERQLDLVRDNQRAWLSVKSVTIELPTAGQTVKPTIIVENTGSTPATIHLGQLYTLEVQHENLELNDDMKPAYHKALNEILSNVPIDVVQLVVAPHHETIISFPRSPVPVTEASLRKLASGELVYVVRFSCWYSGPPNVRGKTIQDFVYDSKSGLCVSRGIADIME